MAGEHTVCKGTNRKPTHFASGNRGKCPVCGVWGLLHEQDVLDVHWHAEAYR